VKTSKAANAPLIFTTYDIGRMTGTDPTTVHKWIDKGLLRGYRTPGGHRRVRAEDLRVFLASHKMPIPRELGGSDSIRVMLVDDDPDAIKALSRMIRRLKPGWELVQAVGGVEALLMVPSHPPDVLIFDACMREVDGFAIARHLRNREETAAVRIIALCKRAGAETARKAKAAGLAAILKKPVTGGDLVLAIETATGLRPPA
jgi:excisionase family DNA binding protein